MKDTLMDREAVINAYWCGFEAALEVLAAGDEDPDSPKPFPWDPSVENPVLKGRALFSPTVLAMVITRNASWLQHAPHTTHEIMKKIFPIYDKDGNGEVLYYHSLNIALFEAGYCPSEDSLNPIWSFPA
jgi:hypothetical protein